jgi:hypothetical protein
VSAEAVCTKHERKWWVWVKGAVRCELCAEQRCAVAEAAKAALEAEA